MRASVGDKIIVASNVVAGAVREGRVIEVRHPDGTPPFEVEWSDTGERTLVFPGPDTRIVPAGDSARKSRPRRG
jgi:hypothetical protein